MSRVIKVRAWHKLLDEFVPVHRNCVIDRDGNICPTDNVVIIQFTGLHDINGVEIYEGDIVSMWYAPQATCKGVISFDKGCFMFDTKDAKPMRATAHECVNEYCNYFTVIGNIYQNPELLESE